MVNTATSEILRFTQHQARLVALGAQGLLVRPTRRARKADVPTAIERMRLLQIDTIHVVARSPYLVLFSRLGDYRREWLDACLAEAAIFECWAHEACFAPIADYPLHRQHMRDLSRHWAISRARRMHADNRAGIDALLKHIRETGAVRSSDFRRSDKSTAGGWWGWKPEKQLLEAAFALGELMIARRERFQRVYDITENVLAGTPHAGGVADYDLPSAEAVRRRYVLDAVRALGITEARWIADYFRMQGRVTDAELEAHVAAGDLLRVGIAGRDAPAYVHRDNLGLAKRAAAGRLRATHTTLLSPFDPLVWDRERASALFGFDYRLECYTPAAKRRFGYFVLPILNCGRLVGRLDAKAHRSDGVFEVKSLFLEDGIAATSARTHAIACAINACARWHQTPIVAIRRTEPRNFAAGLRSAIRE